jgi:hypothetical protein
VDPDPVFQNNADPDPVSQNNADPDPVFQNSADPDPVSRNNADPDPVSQNNADLDLQPCFIYINTPCLDDIMIVSESRPMDSKEAAQEKEMDPLPLLRNGVLAAAPFLLVISFADPDRKIRLVLGLWDPDSDLLVKRYRYGSGSFYHRAK